MTQDNEFLTSLQRRGRVDLEPEQKTENEPEEKPAPAPSAEDQNKEEKSPSQQGDKSPEEKAKDEAGSKEGDDNTDSENKLPFHKHPRWIAQQAEMKELREFRETVTPLLERLGTKPEDRNEETIQIPEWFTELFGENEEAWKKYRAYDVEQRKQLRTEILQEMQTEQHKAVDEQKKQEKWVDDEVRKLSDEGLQFDRNELLKVALEYLPTDENGNISFKKAYTILQMNKAGKTTEKPKSDEKKKVADKTMGTGKATEDRKDYRTSADLRHKTFLDLIPRD